MTEVEENNSYSTEIEHCEVDCYVLNNIYAEVRCDYCFALLKTKKFTCQNCNRVFYCNSLCKKISFAEIHKIECELLSRYEGEKVDNKIRMWSRLLILKSPHLEDGKEQQGTNIPTENIEFPYEELKKIDSLTIDFNNDLEQLSKYLQFIPSILKSYNKEDLRKMYLLLRYITFKIKHTYLPQVIGYGFYVQACVVKYACKANGFVRFEETDMIILSSISDPNVSSLKQITIGDSRLFGFECGRYDISFKADLECRCKRCRWEFMEFVYCPSPDCRKIFIINDKYRNLSIVFKCPHCKVQIMPGYLSRYFKLRDKIYLLYLKIKENPDYELQENELIDYEVFNAIVHSWNFLKLLLDERMFKFQCKREMIAILENYVSITEELFGITSMPCFYYLLALSIYYCKACNLRKKMNACVTLKQMLSITSDKTNPLYHQISRLESYCATLIKEKILSVCSCNLVIHWQFD